MNNNYIQNTNEAFGGISKKFLARLVAIILEKISDRTLIFENNLLKISGPDNILIKNKGNANPGIFVDTNNNVGIGTSTPAYKLHLLGDMKIEGDFYIKGTTYTVDTGNQVTDAIIVTNHDTETALTVNMLGTYPIVEFKSNNNLVSIITSSGCLGVGINEPSDKLEVNGFIKALQGYKVNDILIFDASTNATISGTLDVSKNFTINSNMFKVIANTGDVISKGSLLVYEDTTLSKNVDIIGILNVGQSKFIVYTNGAVDIQGDLKINTTKFVVEAVSGNTTIEGILNLLNDFNINNKFIVNHNTGDTQISGSVQIYENLNVNNLLIVDNINKNVLVNGNIDISTNANVGGNLNINGDFNISGNVNFNSNFSIANNFTVQNSGDVYMVGELKLSKQLVVNNTKFIVDINGNINSEGKLSILDNFNVNTNKFTINAINGDTYIDNILTINNKLLTNNINDTIIFNNNGIIDINKQIDLTKSLNININKFNVDYVTGNVNIAGTLDILKNSHFYESMIINKNISIGENIDISGNLIVNKSVTINENTYNIGNMIINKSLNVNDIFIINSLTKQISFGVTNPIFDVDISGNMRIDNIMINKNLGFNGYLFMMTDIYDPSIKFKVFTNDNNVYKYDSSIITFTNENNTLVRSVIEFDLNYYLPNINIRYIDFSFDLYINSSKQENNGNGFTISLFNLVSCDTITIDELNYNADLSGYTIYLNVFENELQLYKNGLIINQISINNLINNNYHNCKIIINNNIIIFKINNIEILTFTVTDTEKAAKYITLGGWTSSNTLTQKAKNIKCYVEYDNCTKKLQVFGESFLKKTIIDGSLKCNGYIQLDGPIITENNKLNILNKIDLTNDLQLSGNIINNGVIIDMNNIGDFFYNTYLIGNDLLFDNLNNEIKLTENTGSGNIQSIIEFNLNEYIDNNILDEFIFEADFISTGYGIWFYFYNEEPYINSYSAYQQEINGYCLFFDENNNIQIIEKANTIFNLNYTPVENWQKIYIQVKNNNFLLKVNNIEYINKYYNFIYKGNRFGIGGLNGLQKVKNIKITGKINNSNKKLNIFGNTILKGNTKITGYTKYYQDVDICGNLNINKNINVNNLLVVNNSNTNINNNLNITGNINFTGSIYNNGELLDISTQNPLLWLLNNNNNSYYTNLNVGIGKTTPYYNLDVSGNINCTNGYFMNNNKIIDEYGNITSNAYIPFLNATKISSGLLSSDRIPELNASKITSGILSYDCIPELDASIITSGKIKNNILPYNIDISGNITGNKYYNLPIIGNSVLVNSSLMAIVNPYNTTNIIVTANILSSQQEDIIVQIKSITNNNIVFILTKMPVNTSYINYIIYKK